MLIPTKRRCKKKHVIGGAGIFDTLLKLAKTALGKKVIEAGKTVVKEVGLKAIDVGKDVVIAKAKALLDGRPETMLTQKSKDTLASLINNSSAINGGAISIQDLVKRLNTGSGLRLA